MADWNLSINRGILTGYNDAFIIDSKIKEELISHDPNSAEVIRPILRGRNIKKYTYSFNNEWIICIPCGYTKKHCKENNAEDWFKMNFNSTYNYLFSIERVSEKQRQPKTKGLFNRDDQGDFWWELRSCKYMDEFTKQKIIYPCIMSKESCFILDNSGEYYTIAPGNIITGENLTYLLAYLNSKTYYFALRKFYMGGGIEGELKTNRLLLLPVPTANMNRYQSEIVTLTEQIINKECCDSSANMQKIELLESLVQKSIGLSDEEMNYINNYLY